jgi:hypothetical protein
MENKTLLGELAKVCESGNLAYLQKICSLYNDKIDIRGQDDLLIKTICNSKQFHMLDFILDLGKKLETPYDLDSLLAELITNMDEETLDTFFAHITTYSQKFDNKQKDIEENKEKDVLDMTQLLVSSGKKLLKNIISDMNEQTFTDFISHPQYQHYDNKVKNNIVEHFKVICDTYST